ncbi:TIGR01457 family HAD-type hydrolase [Paenibacillus methanolicus]|uniref:Acid sugar phosphatase n=1 Tax=Paenibacillus methanolicus TaxID=582686 RepID=A0A5S5BZR9_9BACL|nr:4-nitrophenyl phosphatase [Paenibacillus methanolicus]
MAIPAPMRGLLIDLDGTLYHGNTMIEGADELILLLRERGIPYLFVTNNSTASPETVAERLNRMGIPAVPSDVCTSAQAAAAYVADLRPGARVFAVGESGLQEALRNAGLELVEERPDYVVQGLDRGATYARLADAVRFIREGAPYVLTNPDVLLPSDGGFVPGAGSIAALLERASGQQPTVIGKPSAILMDAALARLDVPAAHAWVVGDNPFTDIAAGYAAGCSSLLVLTGFANADNCETLLEQAGCRPDEIVPDLRRLMERIEALAVAVS